MDRPLLYLSLTVRMRDNLLTVGGELDPATAPRLDRVLRRLETANRPLCLDLERLRFVDSCGWQVVDDAIRRRRESSLADLTVVNVPRQAQRLLAVLRDLPDAGRPAASAATAMTVGAA